MLQDAYDDTVDVFDLLDEAEKKIFKITEDKLSRGVESIAELGPKALKLLEEIKAKSRASPAGSRACRRASPTWTR